MRNVSLVVLALAVACGGSTNTNPYTASLAASNEVPSNASTATGTATYTVTGTTVNYTITYQNLTGAPTASHIHIGAAGVGGPVVVPFSGLPTTTSGTWSGSFTAADVKAGTSGSTTVAAGNLDDLLNAFKSGNAYTNIHSAQYAGGEIRGQIH